MHTHAHAHTQIHTHTHTHTRTHTREHTQGKSPRENDTRECGRKTQDDDESTEHSSRRRGNARDVSPCVQKSTSAKCPLTAPSLELDLEALKVRLVLDDLDERHGVASLNNQERPAARVKKVRCEELLGEAWAASLFGDSDNDPSALVCRALRLESVGSHGSNRSTNDRRRRGLF